MATRRKAQTFEQRIEQAAKRVYDELGVGHHESIYRRALAVELGCGVAQNIPVNVFYQGQYVGYGESDIVDFEQSFVIETKSLVGCPGPKEVAQLAAYCRGLSIDRGAVVNFPVSGSGRNEPDVLFWEKTDDKD